MAAMQSLCLVKWIREKWREAGSQNGYMTVEASLIVPFFLFCLFVVFLFGIYFYELGVARGILNQVAVEVSDVIKTDGSLKNGSFKEEELADRSLFYLLKKSYPEKAGEGEKELRKLLNHSLLFLHTEEIKFKVGQRKIQGRVKLYYRIPVPILGDLAGSLWENELTVCIGNGNNAEQMRRWRQIEQEIHKK